MTTPEPLPPTEVTVWWHGTTSAYAKVVRESGRLVDFRPWATAAYSPGVYLTSDVEMARSFTPEDDADVLALSFPALNPFVVESGNAFIGITQTYPEFAANMAATVFLAERSHDALLIPGACKGERWAVVFDPETITLADVPAWN
ncbi:hypothetical protein [Tessaracoccus sp.]